MHQGKTLLAHIDAEENERLAAMRKF